MCYNPPLVRDKPLGAPVFVKLVYCVSSPPELWVLFIQREGKTSTPVNDVTHFSDIPGLMHVAIN